ncbi:phage virion morphogenesis protein [uncultured Tateyamaria sp.]|uniref:phage virion morphogenesis protein n=1 Tax=uncultured Tateyamaria sp. TaxID=455651 RepID=UPI002637F352|nr:phage virion morphogenesis protein [uncultured Tateyamaria sp.]
MTGVSITYQAEDEEILLRLAQLSDRLDDTSGFYKNVGEHMLRSTKANFEGEVSPDGQPWKPLMPSTMRRREKRGQTPIQILRATRNTGLAASINYQVETDLVRIGSPKEYAAIHQLGGTIKRKARKGKAFGKDDVSVPAHTINIPARPYIGVGADDEVIIIEIADEWLNS